MVEATEELPAAYLYKVEDIIVPEDEPWRNDFLGRKQQAEKLQKILTPIKQPFVMTLTAPYGMGKSTFLRCWAQDLKNQNIHSITFNAWETDYSSDAFSAFVSSALKQLPQSDMKDQVKAKALKLGGALIRRTPAFLAKVATKHLIGDEAAKDLKALSLSEDELAELSESVANEMFEQQEQIQNAVLNFRTALEEIIANELDGELYIFVDELDRCRPTYAVEVLERIKHIFSVKGVKFIIAIDNNQLQNAIKGVYGINTDSAGYIRKFIDWNQHLSKPTRKSYINHLYENILAQTEHPLFHSVASGSYSEDRFITTLNLLANAYNVSLRDIDQYFTYLRLITRINQTHSYAPIEVYLAAFFKCLFPIKYKSILNWNGENMFNSTPFDETVNKLLKYFSDEHLNGVHFNKSDVGHGIATLIAMMSKQSDEYENNHHRVPVSLETYNQIIKYNPRVEQKWLSGLLTKDVFRTFPHIPNGLKFLDNTSL